MTAFSRLLSKIVLLCVAMSMSLLALEGVLRLTHFEYTPLRIQVVNKWSEWRYYHAFEDRHFVYDPVLIWRPRKGGEFFNEQGYRGQVLTAAKQSATTRIFAIGDSNTLGWPGQGAPNWPMYLEQLLNQNGQSSTVTNAGVYGYTSFQGVRAFEESLAFDPDMVLISFGCNDAMRVTVPDAAFARRKIRTTAWDKVLMKSRTGQVVLAILDKMPGGRKEELVPRVSVAEYKANLNEIIRRSRERNTKVVLLTRPFTGSSPTPWWWKNFAADYNRATLEIGRQSGVPVVDIYSHFINCKDCFVDEAHLTETGLRQMAELLYQAIRRDVKAQEASSRLVR